MAIYYVDYIGGSDANAGTSFATRKQTLSGVFGTAPLSAGDEVRIMRGGDPWTIGNCTWISNTSASIILPNNTTQMLYGDGTWVGSTNVTSSTTTTRKQGATAAQFLIAAGFTTGKLAYYQLSAAGLSNVDLSSYSKISFWLWSDTILSNPMSGVNIRLCSDAFGDVAVETLYWPTFNVNNYSLHGSGWIPITLTRGQAFSATSVNSIAIYHDTDISTNAVTWRVDNVFATNSIALDTLVSKNSATSVDWVRGEHWWSIRSIENNIVAFDMGKNTNHATYPSKGYYTSPAQLSLTATNVPTYVLTAAPVFPDFPGRSSNAMFPPNRRGTLNDKISVTGGWDMVDMTTQSGYSWVGCKLDSQPFISFNNTPYGYTFSNLGFAFGSTAFTQSTISNVSAINFIDCAVVGGNYVLSMSPTNSGLTQLLRIDKFSAIGNGDASPGTRAFGVNAYNPTTQIFVYDYDLRNMYFANCGGGIQIEGMNTNCVINGLSVVNCTMGNKDTLRLKFSIGTRISNLLFDNNWIASNPAGGLFLESSNNNIVENVYISRFNPPGFTPSVLSNYGIYVGPGDAGSSPGPVNNVFKNTYVSRCGHQSGASFNRMAGSGAIGGILIVSGGNNRFYNTIVEYCSGSIGNTASIGQVSQGGISLSDGTNNTYFYNLTTRDNMITGVRSAIRYANASLSITPGNGCYTYIQNHDYNETTPYYVTNALCGMVNGSDNTFVTVNSIISANSTVITRESGQIRSITSPTYPNVGTAWLLDVQSTGRAQGYPLVHNLENVYVDANTTYTASVYVYRSGGAVVGEFIVDGPQLIGMGSGTVAQTTAASISAWEKLSVTFTPTQAGFVGFTVQAYLSSRSVTDLTKDVIWDQFEITPTVTTALTGGNLSTPYSRGGVYLTSSAPGGGSPVVTGGETAYTFC